MTFVLSEDNTFLSVIVEGLPPQKMRNFAVHHATAGEKEGVAERNRNSYLKPMFCPLDNWLLTLLFSFFFFLPLKDRDTDLILRPSGL